MCYSWIRLTICSSPSGIPSCLKFGTDGQSKALGTVRTTAERILLDCTAVLGPCAAGYAPAPTLGSATTGTRTRRTAESDHSWFL